jgi:hypothetical protein
VSKRKEKMTKNLLDIYSDYLIAQNKYATSTGLSDLLDGKISHDKITGFLNKNNFTSKDLWSYVKTKIREIQQEKGGILIIDDFIQEKPYTDENEITAWYYSHAKHRSIKGVNIISSMIRYNDTAFPINYEIIKKDISISCNIKTKQIKRKSSISKNEPLRSMLSQIEKNNIFYDYVLADVWYGSKKNMSFIHNKLNKKFIFGIKANRLVWLLDTKGQHQNIKDLNIKEKQKMIVTLKDLSFPVALIKKTFINEDQSTGTLYLVTNDLNLDADQIYTIYQKRWIIEDYHKSTKQNASLAKSPTKVIRSQSNHIFASIIAYCKLEFLKLKTSLNHFALKYSLLVKANRACFIELNNLQKKINFA